MREAGEGRESGSSGFKDIVFDIVTDAEDLIKQHVSLAKQEIGASLHQAKSTSLSFGIALLFVSLGLIFLLVTLALALEAYTRLEMWGAFAVVSGICLIIALIMLAVAKSKLKAMEEKPLSQTVEALKEDATWLSRTLTHAP